jgi:hypothetical protein
MPPTRLLEVASRDVRLSDPWCLRESCLGESPRFNQKESMQ